MAGKGDRYRPMDAKGRKNWDEYWDKVEKQKEKENATKRQRDEEEHTDGKGTT